MSAAQNFGQRPEPLKPDGQEILDAINAIFRNCAPDGYLSLRARPQDQKQRKPVTFKAAKLDDMRAAVGTAYLVAEAAATTTVPSMFTIPTCTFKTGANAKTINVKEGAAISADFDTGDTAEKLKQAEALLGPATLVAASGGMTAEGFPKLHAHWRLAKPAEGAALVQLAEARGLLATLCGGDPQLKSIVQPIRWPGSWHRKDDVNPKLARIERIDAGAGVDLKAALKKLGGGKKRKVKAPTAPTAPPSLEKLASALAAINNADDYHLWFKVLCGIHHASGGSEEGYALARDWSAQSDKFDEDKQRKKWDSINPDHPKPVTAASIFKIAREEYGWVDAEDWLNIRVPDNAGLFAGMSIKELIDDLCFVITGDWWWSHRHAQSFTATGLNNALSGVYRPEIEDMERQPANFINWLKAKNLVKSYPCFVRRGGQPPVCEMALGVGASAVNMWRPPPPVPKEIMERVRQEGGHAVGPWLIIAGDICDNIKVQVEQLLDWAAAVAMEPGRKPGWSVVLYSAIQGLGKDSFADGLGRTLGLKNSTTIGRKPLESAFNSHFEMRLVHVSDMQQTSRGSMNGSDTYNMLKQATSNLPRTLSVNQKFMPVYDAENLCAWIISTNDEAPMTIPHEDRRWWVAEGRDTKREDRFYAEMKDWLDQPEAALLIRAFLQLRWESMSAERRAAIWGIAPETEAKKQMVNAGLTPVMSAIKMAIDDGDWPDLMTVKDIIDELHKGKLNDRLPRNAPLPNPTQLGIWMKTKFRAVLVPVGKDGKSYPARLPDETPVRIWAIRRSKTYAPMSPREVGKLYASQHGADWRGRRTKKYPAEADTPDTP